MSNKTTFRRIGIAVVASLGFGVLSSGPSAATIQAGATMTATAVNTSVKALSETATVAIGLSWVTVGTNNDTVLVTAIQTTGAATGPGVTGAFRTALSADSAGATSLTASTNTFQAVGGSNSAVSATAYFDVIKPTVPGTYAYTFYATFPNDTGAALTTPAAPSPVTYTFEVTAAELKPDATKSSAWLQGTGGFNGYSDLITADSAITTSKGTGTNAVGTIVMQQRNVDSSTSILLPESVTVVSTGVGLVGRLSATTPVGAFTAVFNDTISVISDGRAGTQTITLSTTSMPNWKTFTITYSGEAATASIAAPTPVMAAGAPAATNTIRVTPKDSLDNLVTANTTMYLHSSDTGVVANATSAQGCTVAATAALGYGTCDITARIVDSGTTKVKFANFAFGTAAASMPTTQIITNEVDIEVVGSAASVELAFDKRSYGPGETAKLTITVKDGLGKPVANQTIVSLFATGGITVSPAGTGTVSAETVTVTAATYGQGKLTYSYAMPLNGTAEVVASATGGIGLPLAARVVVSDTVSVTDPAAEAAESALDAAQEATDAAIAATDAAILAQEAADEAASAAIAAQETAQAAVDAVTALSAEVTKLVAQLATLQKLLNRVAKKVGVKL